MSETARVFNIQRYSIHDGPGIRTVIFFKGCSLNCLWCSNPESIAAAPQVLFSASLCGRCGRCEAACPGGALKMIGRDRGIDELVGEAKKDRPFYSQSGGGVTLSGGEPLLQPDAAAALLSALAAAAIHTAVETAGNVPREAFDLTLPHTDLFIYDIKHMLPDRHRRLTGHGNERILDNLAHVGRTGAPVLIRMPIIPGQNDDPDDVARVAGILAGVRGLQGVELLPYHDFGVNKHAASGRRYRMKDSGPPPPEHMRRLRTLLSERLDAPVIYSE